MARQTKCNRCAGRLGTGPYCPKCGYPTPWASHEDRVEWELRQWTGSSPAAALAAVPAPTDAGAASQPAEIAAEPGRQADAVGEAPASKALASYAPTVIHPKRSPKTARARKASEAKSPLAPKRKVAKQKVEPTPAPQDDSTVASMLEARRLPSLADIEAIAAEGPPLIKILRLLAVRVAVLEAQVPSDVAKTG